MDSVTRTTTITSTGQVISYTLPLEGQTDLWTLSQTFARNLTLPDRIHPVRRYLISKPHFRANQALNSRGTHDNNGILPVAPYAVCLTLEEEAALMAPASPDTPLAEIVDPDAVRRIQEHPIDDDLTVQVAEIFKALSEPTRVRILHALLHAELCVGDLAAVLEMSESAVSHQLRLLRGLRVVRARREGKLVFYALDDEHVTRLFQLSLEHLGHS